MPRFVENSEGTLRRELVCDLVDRVDNHFAQQAVQSVLGKLPKHACEAPWFERYRADRRDQKAQAQEPGGTR